VKLADSSTWVISAGNEQASFILSRLTEVMQLRPVHGSARRLLVLVDNHRAGSAVGDDLFDWTALLSESEDTVFYVLSPAKDGDTLALQLMRLSLVICLHAQTRGGLLLHGALAEREGYAVILAGPEGVGKTTASQRLAPPWRSLCDDCTLVVRDEQGTYWAHPWPTWSRFVAGGPGGTWDVQHAVPLRGIFFLLQAQEDQVESVSVAQAVCLLTESAEQVWWEMHRVMDEKGIRTLRLQRFNNICALAQSVPCYFLRLSLTGNFWQEIEEALAENRK
jgi:SynChlorMet cassette protein ScmC